MVSSLPRPALLLCLLLAAIGTAACGGGEDAPKFNDAGAPFAFSYPADLQKVFADTGREIKGLEPTFRVAYGTDETNVVVVATYALQKDVAKVKKTDLAVAVERAARALARAMKSDSPKRSKAELGPLPATQYDFATNSGSLTTRLLYAFQGKTQYFVRCQWDDSGAKAITAACDEVAQSFSLAK